MDFTIKETWWGIWENTLEKNLFSALQCSQCEFASSHKRSLKIHLLAHSGEKAHKCNQCDYATTQGGRLKKHMQTHTGERPYKCIQCDHTFSQKSNMRSHIKKCHRWLRSLEILFKIKKNKSWIKIPKPYHALGWNSLVQFSFVKSSCRISSVQVYFL